MSKTASPSDSIKPNLDNLETDVLNYIKYLEAENLKLHTKITKLQVSDLSKSNQIKAMEKQLAKLSKKTKTVQNVIVLPEKKKS